MLYQSTGLYSHSYLQHLDINTGDIVKNIKLKILYLEKELLYGIVIWNSITIPYM